ncbi:alpha/beta fold hydrolase [Acidipila rosea]|uniref:Pimeloyl-ACP methyl ester carboxylesterase n=1 Tax=Acidipila rosea TaxID=768535 RepID=A0A4R1L984_9BACT|nr:alpha/beta fold hydrolase [Acidipila rosea]TCK73533.1 pimeloyl-ACP methyl ester carboxylesterase [Acidipila rosea]
MLYSASDGAQLFAESTGRGPDVILLHPTPVHHAFWQPLKSMLANRYRITTVDFRAHGQSESGEGTVTIQKLGDDVLRLMDELDIRTAKFAGCSIGGYTLYELWRRAPERMRALAFCCSKPHADTEQNRAIRRETIAKVEQRGTADFVENMLVTLIGPTARGRDPQIVARAREMMLAMRPASVIAVQQGLAERPSSIETAKAISVPVCIVAGAEDPSSTPADMRELAGLVNKSEYHELPDAGHYAPLEQPETVGSILRRFFDAC